MIVLLLRKEAEEQGESQLLPIAQQEGPMEGDMIQYSVFEQHIATSISRPLRQNCD